MSQNQWENVICSTLKAGASISTIRQRGKETGSRDLPVKNLVCISWSCPKI